MCNRRDLVHAYLGAQDRGLGGYYAESPSSEGRRVMAAGQRIDALTAAQPNAADYPLYDG